MLDLEQTVCIFSVILKRGNTEKKDNQRETALQTYIDKMSELLLEKHLRTSQPEEEVRKIARVRTLTVLRGLDANRKGSVLQFLGRIAVSGGGLLIEFDKVEAVCYGKGLRPKMVS